MNNTQQYCYYNGLIRYVEPLGFGIVLVSTNKETLGTPIPISEIPIIGTLSEVQAYNKTLRENERVNYNK